MEKRLAMPLAAGGWPLPQPIGYGRGKLAIEGEKGWVLGLALPLLLLAADFSA